MVLTTFNIPLNLWYPFDPCSLSWPSKTIRYSPLQKWFFRSKLFDMHKLWGKCHLKVCYPLWVWLAEDLSQNWEGMLFSAASVFPIPGYKRFPFKIFVFGSFYTHCYDMNRQCKGFQYFDKSCERLGSYKGIQVY